MLHVHRREHADARAQQLLDVLIALPMAAPGGVRVSQLVHQHNLRAARKHRIQVEFAQGDASMRDGARRNLLQAFRQRHGVHSCMGLHVAHHHVETLVEHRMGLFQHGVRLADARRIAEEYLELAARVALGSFPLDDLAQNSIGVAARLQIAHRCSHSVPSNRRWSRRTSRPPHRSSYLRCRRRCDVRYRTGKMPSSIRFTFSTFTRASPKIPPCGCSVQRSMIARMSRGLLPVVLAKRST